MKKIIAITNQKGGVGKSTTTGAVAAGLRYRGYKVLTIDMDPQGNLSYGMGAELTDDTPTIYELLRGTAAIDEVIQTTNQGDIIPANILLSGAELEFTKTGREFKLKKTIEPISDRYDYIIIDTPPALGILTTQAYTAADTLIVPMLSDIYSIQGITQLFEVVQSVKEYCNPILTIDGILITKYSKRAIIKRDMKATIEDLAVKMNTKVYKTTIRESVSVIESQVMQSDIQSYAPKSTVAKDYNMFIEEFLGEEA